MTRSHSTLLLILCTVALFEALASSSFKRDAPPSISTSHHFGSLPFLDSVKSKSKFSPTRHEVTGGKASAFSRASPVGLKTGPSAGTGFQASRTLDRKRAGPPEALTSVARLTSDTEIADDHADSSRPRTNRLKPKVPQHKKLSELGEHGESAIPAISSVPATTKTSTLSNNVKPKPRPLPTTTPPPTSGAATQSTDGKLAASNSSSDDKTQTENVTQPTPKKKPSEAAAPNAKGTANSQKKYRKRGGRRGESSVRISAEKVHEAVEKLEAADAKLLQDSRALASGSEQLKEDVEVIQKATATLLLEDAEFERQSDRPFPSNNSPSPSVAPSVPSHATAEKDENSLETSFDQTAPTEETGNSTATKLADVSTTAPTPSSLSQSSTESSLAPAPAASSEGSNTESSKSPSEIPTVAPKAPEPAITSNSESESVAKSKSESGSATTLKLSEDSESSESGSSESAANSEELDSSTTSSNTDSNLQSSSPTSHPPIKSPESSIFSSGPESSTELSSRLESADGPTTAPATPKSVPKPKIPPQSAPGESASSSESSQTPPSAAKGESASIPVKPRADSKLPVTPQPEGAPPVGAASPKVDVAPTAEPAIPPAKSVASPVESESGASPAESDALPVTQPPAKTDASPPKSDALPPRADIPPAKSPPKSDAPPAGPDAPPPKSDAPPPKSDAPPPKSDAPPAKSDAPPAEPDALPTKPTPTSAPSSSGSDIPPGPKASVDVRDDCSLTITVKDVVRADPALELRLQWASAPWPEGLDAEMPFDYAHRDVIIAKSRTVLDDKFRWLLCDDRKYLVDTGLVPGVTYYFRTRYCSTKDSSRCGPSTPTTPPKVSQGDSTGPVSHSNPNDFGIRLQGKVGPDVSNLRQKLDDVLLLEPGRIIVRTTQGSNVFVDVIPGSARSASPAEIADRIRMQYSLITVESMSNIRRCPGDSDSKYQEDCAPIDRVYLSSDNILYFGLIIVASIAGFYFLRSKRVAPSHAVESEEKHGSFSVLDNEDDELEMQVFDGKQSNKRGTERAPAPPAVSELATREFRSMDSEGAAPVTSAASSESVEGSAQHLLRKVLAGMGIPEIGMKRYVTMLEDKWITRVDQLRTYDSSDWKRLGLPEIIEQAVRDELRASGLNKPKTAPVPRGLSLKKPSTAKPLSSVASSSTTASASASSGSTAPRSTPDDKLAVPAVAAASALAPAVAKRSGTGGAGRGKRAKPAIAALGDSNAFGDDFDASPAPMSGATVPISGSTKTSAFHAGRSLAVSTQNKSPAAKPVVAPTASSAASGDAWPTLALDKTPKARAAEEADSDWASLDKELEEFDM